MENWGLVTYRETALLVDPHNTSSNVKQWVALVVGACRGSNTLCALPNPSLVRSRAGTSVVWELSDHAVVDSSLAKRGLR